jgi:hypothetical protein
MSFGRKLIELEIIMLIKISRTQKDKYHIFFHMQNPGIIKDMIVEGGPFEKRKRSTGKKGEGGQKRGRGDYDQNIFYACVKMSPLNPLR